MEYLLPINLDALAKTDICISKDKLLEKENKEKPYILFGAYGALLHPYLDITKCLQQINRVDFSFNPEKPIDFSPYFLGVYEMEGMKLSFQKRDSRSKLEDATGKSTLQVGEINSSAYLSVYIIPRFLLSKTTSILRDREGCVSNDFFEPNNHYTIFTNSIYPLKAVPNIGDYSDRLPDEYKTLKESSVYIFYASVSHLETEVKLLANPTYKKIVISGIDFLTNKLKYNIPASYKDYVESNF